MPRPRAVFAILALLPAAILPVSAQTAIPPRTIHIQAVTRHPDTLTREQARHQAALAREEKRHEAVLAKHQAALLRAEKRHQAALARMEKRHQAALARHQAALARLAKKHQIALARHQAALANHQAALARAGKKRPATIAQAGKNRPAAAAKVSKKRQIATTHGNAGLASWLRSYYHTQDSGWDHNDVSQMVARTTSDFQYVTINRTIMTRDQVITEYTNLLTDVVQKNARLRFHTTISKVALSGDTAVVTVNRVVTGTMTADVGEGYTATANAKSSKVQSRDTWVHLDQGWYMARSEDIFNNMSIGVNAHVN